MSPLSLYVHIPFCERKCLYCDFKSFADKHKQIELYIDALCGEIKTWHDKCEEYSINTIFFGGGTPSFIDPYHIKTILHTIRDNFNVSPAPEITIECNPNSLTQEKLLDYKSFGINRISIGVQSFDDACLKVLGRVHTADQAVCAINLAYDTGFSNINIDLIHSVPNLRFKMPDAEILKKITHVSAYSLIHEQGTAFSNIPPVSELQSIRDQRGIEKFLSANGFKKYEVSNFARTGFECRHNKVYWDADAEYLGFGLAAHGLFANKRFANTEDFESYVRGKAKSNCTERTPNDVRNEKIMLGLRTAHGIPIDILRGKETELEQLLRQKLVKIKCGHVTATARGFYLLNYIIEKLWD